ncbi:TetR/AcrR family transcriptional regulator [Brachybacterium hainanense]|uniref:TetR/AcrR family transcriptional regulator n=1 Tax=Brachybacterium hainanense TaxID=1541174 RepID=A0ABV6RC30_9MICO
MAKARTPRQSWIDEGLRVLAAGGPDAVRVEVLAKNLGVTKGGFYGFFADRDALLEAMLDDWERRSVADVLARVEHEDGTAVSRAAHARDLTFSEELLPIDLAVREWARRDEAVAERLRRVDAGRIDLLRSVIGTAYSDPVEVEARAALAMLSTVGAHFAAIDHGDLGGAEAHARLARIVLGEAL